MRNVLDSSPGSQREPAAGTAASRAGGSAAPSPTAGAGAAGPTAGAGERAAAPADGPAPARIAKRYLLKAAVFGHRDKPARDDRPRPDDEDLAMPGKAVPGTATGMILDVSPHVLVIGDEQAEERFALAPGTHAWRGTRTEPAALQVGDHAVVRRQRPGRGVADRIWANIGRITGIIVRRDRGTLIVDRGDGSRRLLIVPPGAAGRIQVRFPRLEPGYLIDVIGLDRGDHLEGLVPATSQPAYRADHVPQPPLVSGHVPASISGAAIWHAPDGEASGQAGVTYPAVDAQAVRAEGTAGQRSAPGCVRLPYLSAGSLLRVRNDCTGLSQVLPVLGASPTARLFCDRSVTCGPSPRGRIADLTIASFVALGGDLDAGSFNVTIEIGD